MRFTVSGCVAGCVQDASRMRPGCVASADFLEIAKIWAENLKKLAHCEILLKSCRLFAGFYGFLLAFSAGLLSFSFETVGFSL